jgi:hypothetical protein
MRLSALSVHGSGAANSLALSWLLRVHGRLLLLLLLLLLQKKKPFAPRVILPPKEKPAS